MDCPAWSAGRVVGEVVVKGKRGIVIFVAIVFMACGCRKEDVDYRRGISAMQKEENEDAIAAFETSIRRDERVRDSHLQLATIYERLGNHELLALWHYEQALKQTDAKDEITKDIQTAIERNSDVVLQALQVRGRKDEKEMLQLKVRLLEDHAMRQKKWIEELQRENTEYRRMLQERN